MEPPKAYLLIIRTIDRIVLWSAGISALILIPLILANVIEVFMRYVLNEPTTWALEATAFAFGALFMLGAAYALQLGAHVRTDMLWDKFSDRTKGIIDSIGYLVFFLPSMALLFYIAYGEFLYSWSIGELSSYGAWRPAIWPLRGIVPLTAFLLIVQGISELLKSLWAARTGTVLVHHEKIEI